MDRNEFLLSYLSQLDSINRDYQCSERIERVCDEIEKELGISDDKS